MDLSKIFGALVFLSWAVFFYVKFNKLYHVHLKEFLAPDVNKMAKYPVAARYDAVNIEGKFWRYYLIGIFLAPLRFSIMVILALFMSFWAKFLMKVFGVTYKNSQDFHNPYFIFLDNLICAPGG